MRGAAKAAVTEFPRLVDWSARNATPGPAENHCMSSELIKHVTDDSFGSDVLGADKPVLVDYWAEWCGPCKSIAPLLDDVSRDYDGRLQVAKMNVDENQQVPRKYGIRGIPTLMLFKGGEVAATKVGAVSKAQLTAFLDDALVVAAGEQRSPL